MAERKRKPAAKPGESPGEQSPSGEAASSTGSAAASPAEGERLVADPGPAFDPEEVTPEELPPEPEPEAEVEAEWEAEVLSSLLAVKGRLLHAGIGVADEDWLYTELDLAAIVPPLTRIFNRYPAIRQLAPYADPVTLATALGAYAVRSLEERKEELALRAEEVTEVPIAAPEGPPPPAAKPSVPPPPPAPKPSAFPAGAGREQPAAAQESRPAARPRRGGEADLDPEAVSWSVGE